MDWDPCWVEQNAWIVNRHIKHYLRFIIAGEIERFLDRMEESFRARFGSYALASIHRISLRQASALWKSIPLTDLLYQYIAEMLFEAALRQRDRYWAHAMTEGRLKCATFAELDEPCHRYRLCHDQELLDCFGRLLTANEEVTMLLAQIGVLLNAEFAMDSSSPSSPSSLGPFSPSCSSSSRLPSARPSAPIVSPLPTDCQPNLNPTLAQLMRSMELNGNGPPPVDRRPWKYGPSIPTPEAIRLQVQRMEEGPLYVVTRGYAIGVFAEWKVSQAIHIILRLISSRAVVSPLVTGVSGNSHK
ncbi:hypothetical protein C8J56DRAFT_1067233 [Mycena floridula]|nr:hypothetical protein C8J56DRAFT_1067233 [Mycena floridula]